jgi:hypothetical protein
VWMPEIELGIGCEVGTHEGCNREWLYWYDQKGLRANSSSPLKWTKTLIQSSLDDFRCEPGV